VHVVRISLNTEALDVSSLSDEEHERARRFVFEVDRRRFIAAHAGKRQVLAYVTRSSPSAIRFARAAHGKPAIAGADIDVRFNLSHSGERALLALALGREVGVDIEQHRTIDVLELAEVCFSPLEQAALRHTPTQRRLEAFFRGWSRKESFIKARGDGLSFPLAGFDVSLEGSASQLLLTCIACEGEAKRWMIINLATDTGYSAALTVEGGDWKLVNWDSVETFCAAATVAKRGQT
jgi:4'-phosphopantetheinyl transferase